MDDELDNESTNPIQNNVISSYIEDKELVISSALNELNENLDTHSADTTVHVTSAEKTTWNNKQDAIPYTCTSMTQSAYDALETKDNDTIYFITL